MLFLLSTFAAPLVEHIPSEAAVPALVLVGFLMMSQVKHIAWDDNEIAIPAFLTIVLMPFTYSITAGIGAGFIAYVVLKLVKGKIVRDPPAAVDHRRACSWSTSRSIRSPTGSARAGHWVRWRPCRSRSETRSHRLPTAAWVAPNATLAGSVTIGEGASVWYGAVLRADNEPITIGARSNVQDNCVFHVDKGKPVVLGEGVSVGHGAVIHGATVEDHVLVGMGAIIMNGAVVGTESLIAAGALISEGAVIPPRSLVAGVPGKVRRELSDDEVATLHTNAGIYEEHRDLHRSRRRRRAPEDSGAQRFATT